MNLFELQDSSVQNGPNVKGLKHNKFTGRYLPNINQILKQARTSVGENMRLHAWQQRDFFLHQYCSFCHGVTTTFMIVIFLIQDASCLNRFHSMGIFFQNKRNVPGKHTKCWCLENHSCANPNIPVMFYCNANRIHIMKVICFCRWHSKFLDFHLFRNKHFFLQKPFACNKNSVKISKENLQHHGASFVYTWRLCSQTMQEEKNSGTQADYTHACTCNLGILDGLLFMSFIIWRCFEISR